MLLLDGAPAFRGYHPTQHSNRVYALSSGTARLLQRCGAWPHILAIRSRAVRRMQVSDAATGAWIAFDADDAAELSGADMAYIVENDVLQHAVLQELKEAQAKEQVELRFGARIEQLQLAGAPSARGVVQLKGGEAFSCDLLVSTR